MGKELFETLIQEDQVKLIYCKTNVTKDKTYINYTIICDVDSVADDLSLLNKISATMFVIKELLARYNIQFSYTVKTSDEFDREIANDRKKVALKLSNTEIMHCKEAYYQEIIDEMEYTKKRA